jgi:putative restriction endonuclease
MVESVRFWIGVTDFDWYTFLADRRPEDVNFWQPNGRESAFKFPELMPFLFKLKAPHNMIAGVAFFVRQTVLPLSLAWKVFGERNGADSWQRLHATISRYRQSNQSPLVPDPPIGCIALTDPLFFPRSEWIQVPNDWASNIVQGKYFDSTEGEGKRVWLEVQDRLARLREGLEPWEDVKTEELSTLSDYRVNERYGEAITKVRLGQGGFRLSVIDSYSRRCAISGEKILPVLEAAHIKPYALSGAHKVANGLLLRSDIHTLFDAGYLTVVAEGEDFRVNVSTRLKTEFDNGKDYYKFHGQPLAFIPTPSHERPAAESLIWHNENTFR